MGTVEILYGLMVFAAFALFIVTLGIVSWQTERYLGKHDNAAGSSDN